MRAGFDVGPRHPLKSRAIAKAIAGMSGRPIISSLNTGSLFIPTIGDGPERDRYRWREHEGPRYWREGRWIEIH